MNKRSANSDHFVYLLEQIGIAEDRRNGQGSRAYYVGMATDPLRRLKEHNSGRVTATCSRKWRIIATCKLSSKSQASTVERWMKVGNSRQKRERFLYITQTTGEEYTRELYRFINEAQAWNSVRALRASIFSALPHSSGNAATSTLEVEEC